MGSRVIRRGSFAVAVVAAMAFAACDTEPASEVYTSAATLNAKGACPGDGVRGSNQYQVRDYSGGGSFKNVGPRFTFDCGGVSGEVALPRYRVEGLKPGNTYQFRLVTRLDTGDVITWDANGTNGGSAYDAFTTESIVAVDEYPGEEYVSPPDGSATAAGCFNKEIKNIRRGRSFLFRTHLWTIELRTRWRYCGGQILKMWPASAECWVTSAGAATGYRCLDPDGHKVRAISTGGNPEHGVYTYSFRIQAELEGITFFSTRWCATNQISGSGAHRRHGSCDIQPW